MIENQLFLFDTNLISCKNDFVVNFLTAVNRI